VTQALELYEDMQLVEKAELSGTTIAYLTRKYGASLSLRPGR